MVEAGPVPELLLLEPFGGLAGDMLLAALLDLCDPRFQRRDLERLAAALVPGECELVESEVLRGAFRARHLDLRTAESRFAAPADLAALRGPASGAPSFAALPHEHAGLLHSHAQGAQPHRHLCDLLALLEPLPPALLSARGRARAARVLERLARAEAAVHGIPVEQVHFHEVGAVDTLIDVAGACLALERLGITRVHSLPPLVGAGSVRGAHGEMPVPTPGTAELLRGLPHQAGGPATLGERLTPTGAALLAELVDSFEWPAGFVCAAIGYGAGTRNPDSGPPNLLRVQLGHAALLPVDWPPPGSHWVELLEFNLDDSTGEEIGYCLQRLRAAGALEAWSSALQMKKDRPGALVSALYRPAQRAMLVEAALASTPTLGVRFTRHPRLECAREEFEVELAGARVRIKHRLRPGHAVEALDLSPEHDQLVALAERSGGSLRELERQAVELALRLLAAR